MWDNPSLFGRTNHLVVWGWLLDHVMWEEGARVRFKGAIIPLAPGQMTCGATQISLETGCAPSTASRVLNDLHNERLIERQTDNRCSLVTVLNWDRYQSDERQSENQVRGRREADERQMRVKEEDKKIEEKKERHESGAVAPTPAQEARAFFANADDREAIIRSLLSVGTPEEFARGEVGKFCRYWTERNRSGTKQRWETERTFEVRRRLKTWLDRASTPFPRKP